MIDVIPCSYCDRPAVAYCDFVVDRDAAMAADKSPARSAPWDLGLCCKSICEEHRRKVGHMCDRSRRTVNNQSDTIDYCAVHVESP